MAILTDVISSLTTATNSFTGLIIALAAVLVAIDHILRRAQLPRVKQAAGAVYRALRTVGQEISSAVQMPQDYPRWRLLGDVGDAALCYVVTVTLILFAAAIILLAALKGALPVMTQIKVLAWLGITVWLAMAMIAQGERARLHAHQVLGELRAAKKNRRHGCESRH